MAFPNKNDEQLGLTKSHPVTLAGFMGEMRKKKPTKKRGLIGRKVKAKI